MIIKVIYIFVFTEFTALDLFGIFINSKNTRIYVTIFILGKYHTDDSVEDK